MKTPIYHYTRSIVSNVRCEEATEAEVFIAGNQSPNTAKAGMHTKKVKRALCDKDPNLGEQVRFSKKDGAISREFIPLARIFVYESADAKTQ